MALLGDVHANWQKVTLIIFCLHWSEALKYQNVYFQFIRLSIILCYILLFPLDEKTTLYPKGLNPLHPLTVERFWPTEHTGHKIEKTLYFLYYNNMCVTHMSKH